MFTSIFLDFSVRSVLVVYIFYDHACYSSCIYIRCMCCNFSTLKAVCYVSLVCWFITMVTNLLLLIFLNIFFISWTPISIDNSENNYPILSLNDNELAVLITGSMASYDINVSIRSAQNYIQRNATVCQGWVTYKSNNWFT